MGKANLESVFDLWRSIVDMQNPICFSLGITWEEYHLRRLCMHACMLRDYDIFLHERQATEVWKPGCNCSVITIGSYLQVILDRYFYAAFATSE